MITKKMIRFISAFEAEMERENNVEKAIEIACSYDLQNMNYYEV